MSFDFSAPQEQEGINLIPQAPTLPIHKVEGRAARADYALGDKSPGKNALRDEFMMGNEPVIREQAARQADNEFKEQKLAVVNDALAKGASLTPVEMQTIVNVGTTPEANPNTVLEDKYARNVVTAGVVGDPGKNLVFQSAFAVAPEKTNEGTRLATAAVSRKEQARDILDHTEAAYDNLPWVYAGNVNPDQQTKFGAYATSMLSLGFAQYVNQRNLLTSDPIQTEGSWLPGTNKLEQISYLYRLPHNQFKDALMAAAGPGSELFKKDPHSALDFVKSAVQFSSSDAYVDNTFGIINVASLAPGRYIAKAAGRFGRTGETAFSQGLKTAEEVLRASAIPAKGSKQLGSPALQSGLQAAEDILGQSSKPPTPSYYVPEAAAKNFGSFTIKDGKPLFQTADGAFVDVATTPQSGFTQITPTEPTTLNQYTTKHGTFDFNAGETTQVDGRRTVFVDQKAYENLSQVLDEANTATSSASGQSQRYQIMEDAKGNLFVGDRDKGGKMVKGSKVKVSNEPKEGLYPIQLPEGNDPHLFDDFGAEITQVKNNYKSQNYKIGATIASQEELDARVALADITKSQGYTHPQDVLSKMGQHEVAAQVGAREAAEKELAGVAPRDDFDAVRRHTPGTAQPQPYFDGGSSLSWRRAGELLNEFKAALGGTRVERLTPAAFDEALTIARNVVKQKYNRMSADSIRDQVTHWDALTNTYAVETKIGLPNGDLFASRAQATNYKNLQYRMGSAVEIKQEGTSFYLSHIQHLDETQTAARQALVIGNETPKSLVNAVIGRAKSAASTLSAFQREQRATATHAQSFLRAALDDEAEKLSNLHKGFTQAERHELNDILIHNRDYIPPGRPSSDRGFFYNSRHDFDVGFMGRHGRMPSDAQWEAYETYTRLSDIDWLLRESEVYRDKARQGVRSYRFSFTNREGNRVQTEFLSGKEVADFNPMVHPNANVYVLPDNIFTSKNDLKATTAQSKYINDKLKAGEYKIVQVYDPRSKPLLDTTGIRDDIHFVVTNKFDERAIQFGENVEYRPGGHVIYLGQHYVKQPQIGPGTNGALTHFGDVALKAFETKKEATFWAQRYDTARQHLLNNRQADFDTYVAANLPETPAQLRRMFNDGTFNLDHPFMYTHAGRDTLQSNEDFLMSNPAYQGLKDTFSAYNMRQTQDSAFLADRGAQLNTIERAGTAANPIYNNVPAPLMDPYSALQKGMSQIVRARWMTDIKHMAAESWIQEFGHFFDQSKLPIERLRLNPWYYINHLDAVDRAKMLTNPEAYAAMKTARARILQFVGAKDEVEGMMDALNAAIVDKIATTVGDKAAVKAEQTYLPFIKNVPQFMRRATFELVDGLGNIVQLFQQAVGATHSFAVSPKNAMHSLTMSYLGRRMAKTEDAAIHDRMLDVAQSMGWNRQDARAAFDAWRETGVHNVGGEVTQLSELDNPTLFKTTFGKILDKGRYFFTKGEQVNRDVAFFTAFRDWRDANPGRAVDNRARTEIMGRFDTLYLNMSRASNTFYNEGVLSIPTQFWTWNFRFAEQMMTFGAGRQLTVAEKARVVALNSIMWGVPSTLGGITLGLGSLTPIPFTNYDDIRQYALNNGINVSDKAFQVFSEGVPTMLLNLVSGHETSLHRFAPNADQLRIFRDIQTGKKDWFEAAFGASGSMFYKVVASVHPFYAYTMDAFTKDGNFKIKVNDFVNAAEQIKSFELAERAWIGWSTGRYISKNGQLQSEVDKFESVMLGLGLEPQRVADAWQRKAVEQGRKNAQAKLEKRILEDSAIAFRAAQDGDTQTFNDYMGRVKTWTVMGGFTHREEKAIWKKAIHGQESLVENVDKMWLNRHPSMQQIPNVQQYFENLQGAK